MAARYTVQERGVLKLASLYIFPRQRTSSTFAAPPVGEFYRTKPIFQYIYILPQTVCHTTKNSRCNFL